MAENNTKPHLHFNGYYSNEPYKYPKPANGSKLLIKNRDRAIHGNSILRQLENLKEQFNLPENIDLPQGIIRDDAIYVEFVSDWGFQLKFESLESNKDDPQFQILNIKEEKRDAGENVEYRYSVTLMMTEGGVSEFIKKVKDYLNPQKQTKNGQPNNRPLFDNIELIQRATLKAFWTDAPEIPFPEENENVWWEVWFRRTNVDEVKIGTVIENLRLTGVIIGDSELIFAEHRVRLVKGTAVQLSQSLLLLDNLAELRKPQETADFISHKNDTYEEQKEWLDDLVKRTEVALDDNCVFICLLDSGVNNIHPLIAPFLPDNRLYSYRPQDWSTNDSWPNGGHGTGVAGMALYGDMLDALANPHQIHITHGLESFKIIQNNDPNDPVLYGVVAEEASSKPIIDSPNNPRVFCMTITDKSFAFKGRPSAWSAAIDKIAFGSVLEPITPQLFIVSGGNVEINLNVEFPLKNFDESIHDPGQSYNAITVGTYTRKDRINPDSGYSHLAHNGEMAPSNSTSMIWERQWPIKPDIVMEGGNLSTNGTNTSDHSSLKLLSADSEFPKFTFIPFGDTSAAAALASKMAAELRTVYPEYWPETIRALMIHSAEWTDKMLEGRNINNEQERINLIRSVGYGVPIKEKALNSANNSLTLIAEREIQPYRFEASKAVTNEYHLFELPWPADVLREVVFEQNAKLTITLSYFIEPNPGSRNRRYANNFQYHSHALDFAVIKPRETLPVFKRRISAAAVLPDDEKELADEPWTIKRVRSKGSVKKDFITMSGADMAERNVIAVYPKNGGWYRTRKKLGKVESRVRYSLIVTIETPNTDIDIYTPVFNQIANVIEVRV